MGRHDSSTPVDGGRVRPPADNVTKFLPGWGHAAEHLIGFYRTVIEHDTAHRVVTELCLAAGTVPDLAGIAQSSPQQFQRVLNDSAY